jgi:hypothetical protein
MRADKARRDRYCSESGHPLHRSTCPLWARNCLLHCTKTAGHFVDARQRMSQPLVKITASLSDFTQPATKAW